MNFNFGQFRRNQIETYLTPLKYELAFIENPSPVSKTVYFKDAYIVLDKDNPLENIDENNKTKSYYLRMKIFKLKTEQDITIKLENTNKIKDNLKTLETIHIDSGNEKDYIIYDLVITPNQTYDRIKLELNRTYDDYTTPNTDGTYGRIIKIEIQQLDYIYNIINYLNPSINNLNRLKQIGVQGKPGLLMCINGEPIRIGRSGIYEINNGIIIHFIGFILEPDDKEYFILDYQY